MSFSSLYKFDDGITPEDHHSIAYGLSSILNLAVNHKRVFIRLSNGKVYKTFFAEKYKVVTLIDLKLVYSQKKKKKSMKINKVYNSEPSLRLHIIL